MSDEPRLVCVLKCQGVDLANIYKSKLEAAGIPSLLRYESAGLVFGITVDGLGEVRVMVPEEYADEAQQLLEVPPDVSLESWEDDGQQSEPRD